jgi:predicted nucleotidyltransferase
MLTKLRQVFGDRPTPGVVAVYLFGSYAQGRARTDSDVDLGILLDPGVHHDREQRFAARLEVLAHVGGRLGAPADVVILNDAPPLLGREIVTDGIAVRVYDKAADHAYRRDVQLRAADIAPFIERHRRGLLAGLTT